MLDEIWSIAEKSGKQKRKENKQKSFRCSSIRYPNWLKRYESMAPGQEVDRQKVDSQKIDRQKIEIQKIERQ
jgi:hypothetical protein